MLSVSSAPPYVARENTRIEVMSSEPERIDHYRITRKLGQGGMGIVYAAHDERLHRQVAIKMILDVGADATARERFWREARAAAAVNHPHVCQLYDVGEIDGQLYIVMELLEGESLASRLDRGPVDLPQALNMALSVLDALDALHEQAIVHRDLKPSNVFLTKFGVKLLDFGLARPVVSDQLATVQDLTLPGNVVGTPAYMAPEQLSGQPSDARADLFTVGVVLCEIITGKSPFAGANMVQTMHAILNDRPLVLTGSSTVDAVDRIIQRSLEKLPAARYQSAREMADDVRNAVVTSDTSGEVPVARAMTRLVVLPFRVLRSDPETDFMAFGLADAITGSLSVLESLVVRSSLAASEFAEGTPDLKRLAREIDVDAVLTGTLMRAGDQIRVNAQLLEAPGGTVLWSESSQSPIGDLFKVQDDFTQHIVESLSIPLTRREEQMLKHDVPATAHAYEFYLRGHECARDRATWLIALDLYKQCIDEDPNFAPAWAHLGRMQRLNAIYVEAERADEHLAEAEASFKRALELNPDLPLAHSLCAYLEVDFGRAKESMLRLLDVASRHRADPEIFAGLVHACRYCGLLDASIAAYEKGYRLDPNIRTSVCHSYWFSGQLERAVETDSSVDAPFMKLLAEIRHGKIDQVLGVLTALGSRDRLMYGSGWQRLVAALTGDKATFDEGLDDEVTKMRDPEGIFYWALMAMLLGDTDRVIALLQTTLDRGWFCYQAIAKEPVLDDLRSDSRLSAIVRQMESRQREAAATFVAAGGSRLLGLNA